MNNDSKTLGRRLKPESTVKSKITATKEQLLEIGCDRDLMGLELDVADIDKWVGMYAPCSTVFYDYKLDDYTFLEDYIIPTRWLVFM